MVTARADLERKEYERAQRKEQRRLRMQADSESKRPVVEGQDTGDVSLPISRRTLLLPEDALRKVARVPINRIQLPQFLRPRPAVGRRAQLQTRPPLLEQPLSWNYQDARPIGDRRPDELTTDYRQALIDARARFLTRCFPALPDFADMDLPVAVIHPRVRPVAVDPYPWQMADLDPPPGWPHALPQP